MDDLKQIKNKYGEEMSHLCRELFPTILESDGLLFKLLSDHFDYYKGLYNDIVDNNLEYAFKNYIYSLIDVENNNEIITNKTPSELLDKAGYILYECKSEEEIQSFKKYYSSGEELCTFKDKRLNTNYVFFAIKKDVDNIKREDFIKPERQDKYGTSVISIQFTKGNVNTLSIKNRYNHTVNNPDATFSNNLENIIPGLTNAFEKEYNLNIDFNKEKFEIPNYVNIKGKYYKYNYEINNKYYCPNNIIIDNFEVKRYDKERYIILDYFILDMKEKRIYLYDETIGDAFIDEFNNIEKIEIKKAEDKKIIIDTDIEIRLDKDNNIIKYINNRCEKIGNKFLYCNESLQKIELPNVKEIGDNFLFNNEILQELYLPNVEIIKDGFLNNNESLQKIELPNVKEIGDNFLFCNKNLQKIELPNVEIIGNWFLYRNKKLQELYLPNVKEIGYGFLSSNKSLQKIELPNIERIGNNFLCCNENLQEIELPNVKEIGYGFLSSNKSLQKIELPNIERIGNNFLCCNENLQEIELPNVKEIGDNFLFNNEILQELYLPNVKEIGNEFLYYNERLQKIELPNVEIIGNWFLYRNKKLQELYLPNLDPRYYSNICKHLSDNFNQEKGKILVKKIDLKNIL